MDKSKFNNLKEIKKFSIVFSIILIIIASIQLIMGNDLSNYFYGVGLLFLIIGFTLPILMKPIFILFLYFGFVMNWIITRVLLSLLFYFLFTPIGLISRLVGKRYLDTKFDKNQETYWLDASLGQQEKRSYEDQF